MDINSEYLGMPVEVLMENAGRSVAEFIEEEYDRGNKIGIVCGTGNNGGDGFVAARYLKEKNKVWVLMARSRQSIKTELAKKNFEKIADISSPADDADLKQFDVVVDGLLGTGIHGDMEEPFKTLIGRINSSGSKIVSIDIPSGLGSDLSVKPNYTVTFHDEKDGMTKKNSGNIIIRDIGIPADAVKYVGPGEFVYYPIPGKDSHKGENGRVLIIGGGPYTGAPALAGLSAYRIGVDLVHIATPMMSYYPIASYSPNFIVHRLSGDNLSEKDLDVLRLLSRRVDAVLIGPGAGDHPETYLTVQRFVRECDKPIVIDADGIGAVSRDLSVLEGKKGVITPHAMEFKTLSGITLPDDYEGRSAPVREFAKKIGMTILLKGRIDVVSDGDRVKLNRTGNAAMSVGGTGDVLAGQVVGLISKGVDPFDAARISAFTNGFAGDLAFEELGFSLLATDVIDKIPVVLKRFLERFI
ncbi:MAG: NAD(P)H-hydrate dehydratase [Methanomassiliicoccales archaeon]|nr:NAD(P)H-hydrate dehydratase [Methanomassiliicoccales archaeon]